MNSYIICSPDIESAYSKALDMACELTGNRAKVLSHSHPDVITITKDKSELTVDAVRSVVSDAAVLPNEADCKVYIFKDGKDMNISAQNAALKLLEEPPAGVYLFLISDRASSFLQTIRSRCVEININSSKTDSDEDIEFALDLIQALGCGNALKLYRFCEQNNKMTISECRSKLQIVSSVIADMLTSRRDSMGLNTAQLLSIEELMEKCLKYLGANVNVKQIFGIIEVANI